MAIGFAQWTDFFASLGNSEAGGADVIQVGLDGSWGEVAPHVFSYGGVAGTQPQWNALDAPWMAALKTYGLTEFHMVDAANFRGEFSAKSTEWGAHRLEQQDAVVCSFIDVIRASGLEVVVISAEAGLLSSENKAAKKRDVFEHVVRQLHDKMTENKVDQPLAFICDREQDMVKPVVTWLEKLALKDRLLADRIAGVCYMRRQTVLQIQAADLVAYLFREEVERKRHRPSEPQSPWIVRLSGDRIVHQELSVRSEFLP